MFYDCAKHDKRGELEIASFRLGPLTGEDEIAAAYRAGGDTLSGAAFQEQLVADAIREVDLAPVTRPFISWADWGQKTRDVVRKAFRRENIPTPVQLALFVRTRATDGRAGIFDGVRFGLDFQTIRVAELGGRREIQVLESTEGVSGLAMNEALIGASITHVDGVEVGEEIYDWSKWSYRTRAFVREAHVAVVNADADLIAAILEGDDSPPGEAGPSGPG